MLLHLKEKREMDYQEDFDLLLNDSPTMHTHLHCFKMTPSLSSTTLYLEGCD